jgi:cystathionine beta-lyase/cystathionine gamma-synthase
MAAMEILKQQTYPLPEWGVSHPPMCGLETTLFQTELFTVVLCFFLKLLTKTCISTFVDITKLDVVEAAITPDTKVLYCESLAIIHCLENLLYQEFSKAYKP